MVPPYPSNIPSAHGLRSTKATLSPSLYRIATNCRCANAGSRPHPSPEGAQGLCTNVQALVLRRLGLTCDHIPSVFTAVGPVVPAPVPRTSPKRFVQVDTMRRCITVTQLTPQGHNRGSAPVVTQTPCTILPRNWGRHASCRLWGSKRERTESGTTRAVLSDRVRAGSYDITSRGPMRLSGRAPSANGLRSPKAILSLVIGHKLVSQHYPRPLPRCTWGS